MCKSILATTREKAPFAYVDKNSDSLITSFVVCIQSLATVFALKNLDRQAWANSVDSDQTSKLFATHPPVFSQKNRQ